MRRILLIAKRDYIATVLTKAFLFGLVFFPLMMGGGFFAFSLARGRADVDRRIAILDRTGLAVQAIIQAAQERNRRDMFDKTGKQVMPRYVFETVPAGGDAEAERLALSDRLRSRDLFAFIEIGPEVLHPSANPDRSPIRYYSNDNGGVERWMVDAVNEGLRRARLAQLGVDPSHFGDVLGDAPLVNMTPVTRDPSTGAIASPRPKDPATTFMVPYLLVMLLFFVTLMGSVTMLPAVAEDKLQRVFEMLLVSATPLELMAGKALAAVGRALTSSAVFVIGGLLALQGAAMIGVVPFPLLPWFFAYVLAETVILATLAIALGAACGSPQDAQSLNQILILPVVIPLVLMVPILQQPGRAMATVLSLFPPFTPTLMLLRQATPGGVPAWQPWAGLLGVLVYGVVVTWAASRIFRVAILFQGTAPKLPELFRWAVRG